MICYLEARGSAWILWMQLNGTWMKLAPREIRWTNECWGVYCSIQTVCIFFDDAVQCLQTANLNKEGANYAKPQAQPNEKVLFTNIRHENRTNYSFWKFRCDNCFDFLRISTSESAGIQPGRRGSSPAGEGRAWTFLGFRANVPPHSQATVSSRTRQGSE